MINKSLKAKKVRNSLTSEEVKHLILITLVSFVCSTFLGAWTNGWIFEPSLFMASTFFTLVVFSWKFISLTTSIAEISTPKYKQVAAYFEEDPGLKDACGLGESISNAEFDEILYLYDKRNRAKERRKAKELALSPSELNE